MKKRKEFLMCEEDLEIIQTVKKEKEYRTDIAALHEIIQDYIRRREKEEEIHEILKRYEEDCRGFHERLRWATKVAEQNSIVILDLLNTILLQGRVSEIETCIPVDFMQHSAIKESQARIKEKIAYFKQMKDYRAIK